MTQNAARSTAGAVRALVPRGTPLPDADWQKRHTVISAIALLHIPAVFVYALLVGVGITHALLVETLPIAAAAVAGTYGRASRRTREVMTTVALTTSSAVLIHLSGGYVELHFHFFVIVALVTLYQQWGPFLVAIGFVALHHGFAGAVAPSAVYNHPAALANPWGWAAIHAGFIAAASAVGLANWKFNEMARERAEDYFRRLYEGEHALVQRMRETDRVKSELVSAVSHEFRTPLTAILGLAATLEAAPEETADHVADFAGRIHRQGRRLQQLVENLLETERPLDLTDGVCDASDTVAASISLAVEGYRSDHPVVIDVTPGLQLPLAFDAAQLVLVNLVGNALKFADASTAVTVRALAADGGIVIEVQNHGPEVPAEMRQRIFEPFVQGDASTTRTADGVGLGLHIIRRVVTSNGGNITVTCHDGVTTFRVWLDPHALDGSDGAAPSMAVGGSSST